MPINFTPEQQAVLDYKGDAFVLAVAGSGKTATIVEKINRVKQDNPGAKVLYVTFTRKARDEGKSRIHNRENVMIMNYHGLAYRIVEEHKGTLQYPEIDIVSDSYCLTILKGLYPTLKKEEHREMFKCINLHKSNHTSPKDMSPRDRSVYVQFNDIMETQKKLTFSDLIPLANKVLEGKNLHPYMRSFLKYDFIAIDESQDSCYSMFQLIRNLKDLYPESQVVLCGDLFQSIMSFMGARPDQCLESIHRFNAQVLPMQGNFRSTGNILDLANLITAEIEEFKELRGELWTDKPAGEPIHFRLFPSSMHEHEWVCREILRLVNREGIRFKDIMVLFRVNTVGIELEKACIRNRIPLHLVKGSLLERKIVGFFIDVVKLSDLLVKNDIEAEKIAYGYLYKIGPELVDGIGEGAYNLIQESFPEIRIMDKLANVRSTTIKGLGTKKKDLLFEVHHKLKAMMVAYQDYLDSQTQLEEANKTQGVETYLEFLRGFLLDLKFVDDSAAYAESVTEDLDSLLEIFSEFNGTMLERINQMMMDFSEAPEHHENEDRVQGMTVHKAKGLESRVVFILGLNQFPPGGREISDEERRLAYVAVTRPKERLYICQNSPGSYFLSPLRKMRIQGKLDINIPQEEFDRMRSPDDPEMI